MTLLALLAFGVFAQEPSSTDVPEASEDLLEELRESEQPWIEEEPSEVQKNEATNTPAASQNEEEVNSVAESRGSEIVLPPMTLQPAEKPIEYETVSVAGIPHTVIDGRLYRVDGNQLEPVAASADSVFAVVAGRVIVVDKSGVAAYSSEPALNAPNEMTGTTSRHPQEETHEQPVAPPPSSEPEPGVNPPRNGSTGLIAESEDKANRLESWNDSLEEIHVQSVELSQLNDVMVKLQQNVSLIQQLRPNAHIARELLAGATLLDVIDGMLEEDARVQNALVEQQGEAERPVAPEQPKTIYTASDIAMISGTGLVLRHPDTLQTISLDVGESTDVEGDTLSLHSVTNKNGVWSVELEVNGEVLRIEK